ncbi:MAG: helix-hairpin-helix domain-containing protein [Candidatus Competibacter denitrificans]|jgi:predicted flap endonuclease-1-like 5' DNA nuclease
MKPWINEDIFKSWTQAQKRLWNSLCSAVPFQPPAGVEAWRETYLKNLDVWEAAVRRTLSQEASWVQRWVEQVAQEKGAPELMTAWVRQMEEVLQRWVQTQNQWWDEYFMVLRRGSRFMDPDQAGVGSISVAPPRAEIEPDKAIKPVAVKAAAAVAPAEIKPIPPVAPAEPRPVPPVAPADILTEIPSASVSAELEPDDLKLISGVGPALEKKLHAQGINTFRQLANLAEADIDQLEAAIKAAGRIRRDDWIGQAKAQHGQKYQEQV